VTENSTPNKASLIKRLVNGLLRRIDRNRFNLALGSLVAAFVLVYCWDFIAVTIRSGHQGVYWSRFFGGTRDMILKEGTRFKLPWDEVIIYDIRSREIHDSSKFLTKDGMELVMDWSTRYRLVSDRLPELNRTIGPNYVKVVVYPEMVDAIRLIVGRYRADEIYATLETTLPQNFNQEISQAQHKLPIDFQDVMILKLTLPEQIATGIQNKLIAEQNMLSYVFRLNMEEQERRRKNIEAQGIAEFEQKSGISILKWRGLEVTADIAKSNNSKIIIMGTGEQSLPLLLNADK
jgi:regulator of protease activity HflC (stomatin/prohibitin superfamily)